MPGKAEKKPSAEEALPESTKILADQLYKSEPTIRDRLENPHFQRGAWWRKDKLEAIAEARQNGTPENWILESLMRGGLTELTAKRIMEDSRRLYGKGGETG